MYGAQFQKATTVKIFGQQELLETLGDEMILTCTHSGHDEVLQGKDEMGHYKTSRAQMYPSAFCKSLAVTIMQALNTMAAKDWGPDPTGLCRSPFELQSEQIKEMQAEERTRGMRIRAPPLSSQWTTVSRWKLAYRGKWKKLEHTNIQETRCAVGLMRHLCRSRGTAGKRILIFIDSMVGLGALGKGRRQAAAICLAFGMRVLLRYVPSEVNVADGPSRGYHCGVATETRAAHADRLIDTTEKAVADTMQADSHSLQALLLLGRKAMGFAGG
jgi:hypothetical protein